MIPLRFVGLLFFSCLLGAAQVSSPVPARHPETIGGRWETTTPSRIEGIGLEIYTSANRVGDIDPRSWQMVNVRVYDRENGKEHWGYFVVKERSYPESGVVMTIAPLPESFDGHRLQIHFTDTTDIPPFDLDIMFSPAAKKWVGTWSHAGKSEDVVLTRPAASRGGKSNPFVGQWIGEPGPGVSDAFEPTTLNIRQSSDGVVSAWLDRMLAGTERRNGEQLNVESMTDSALVLNMNHSSGAQYQYRGTLSADGRLLAGQWGSPGGGGSLAAAGQFRRAPKNAD